MMRYSNSSNPQDCDYTRCCNCPRRACIGRCAGFADDYYYDRYYRYTYQYVDPNMFRVPYPYDIDPWTPDSFGYRNIYVPDPFKNKYVPNPSDVAVKPDEEYAKQNCFDTGL